MIHAEGISESWWRLSPPQKNPLLLYVWETSYVKIQAWCNCWEKHRRPAHEDDWCGLESVLFTAAWWWRKINHFGIILTDIAVEMIRDLWESSVLHHSFEWQLLYSRKCKRGQALKCSMQVSLWRTFVVKANWSSRHINIIQRLLKLKVESEGFVPAVPERTTDSVILCRSNVHSFRLLTSLFCLATSAVNWNQSRDVGNNNPW